jgi:hypothetical protein
MLPKRATIYIAAVILLGVIACIATDCVHAWQMPADELWHMLAMSGLAVISQLSKAVYMSGKDARSGTAWYSPLLGIMFGSVLMLSPQAIAIVVVTPHLVEWLIERARKTPFLSEWYIQPFNIATHLLCAVTAWGVFASSRGMLGLPFGAVLAALTYLVVNHFLVGQVMVWACGLTWSQTGVWELNNLLCDAAFMLAGMGTAVLMSTSLLLSLPTVLVLLIGQRFVARALVRTAAA